MIRARWNLAGGAAIACAVAWLGLALTPAAFAQSPELDKTYAPPRSVADIIGSTRALKGDRAEHGRRQRLLASEPPANASRRELVIFHFRRARAAQGLGDLARAMMDYRKALELSRIGESYEPAIPNRRWIISELGIAEQLRGNLAEAIRLFEQVFEEAPDPGFKLVALLMMSRAQGGIGELAELEKSVQQAESVFAGAWSAGAWATWEMNWTSMIHHIRAWHHYYFGRYEEAELSALRALRASEAFLKRGAPVGVPRDLPIRWREDVQGNLAYFQIALNKLNEAEYHARQVLASMLSRYRNASPALTWPLERLGDTYLAGGRFKDAETLFREALRLLDETSAVRTSLGTLALQRWLAHSISAQERWPEALAVFRELQSLAGTGVTKSYANVDVATAYSQLRAEQPELAANGVRERLEWYEKNGLAELPDAILMRGIYALALSATGRAAAADREFEAVIPKLTGRGAPSLLAADATAFTELQKRWIVEGYVEHLRRKAAGMTNLDERARVIEEALAVSDAVRGRGVQLAIQQASLRAAARTPALAELARKEQDLRNEIGVLYAVLNTRVSAAEARAGTIERQMRERIASATEELGRIAERLRREFGDYANLVAPRLPELAQVRAALRPGESLLALHLAGDRVFVWLAGREGPVAFHSTDERAAIEAEIRLLRRALDPNSAGIRDHILAFDVAAANRLYQRLIQPLVPALAQVQSLVVVANGALQELPLGVLLTEAHATAPDTAVYFREYRAAPWLAKRYAIAQAPSLNAFLSLRSRPAGREGRIAFAGFGDPIFSKEQAATTPALTAAVSLRGAQIALRSAPQTWALDSAKLARLPRLPDTAEEIASIARTLGAIPDRDTYLGARANESEVKRADLSNRKVLAFATHGLVPGELNGLTQPALALTSPDVAGAEGDGLLTMEEVLGLKLDADWVVLSACNTASGQGAGSEAISGLGRAFFYAGARALLVSSWPVETVSAKLLTTRIFELQSKEPGLARAEALRRSMLELVERGEALGPDGKPAYSYAHPLFWAPFSVVGEGR